MAIKILTGWSAEGGSTTAFINLVNALNEYGYDTTLFGPHNYPATKCKFAINDNYSLRFSPQDTIIVHFLVLAKRLNCKNFILSSHEQNIFEIKKINYKIYDKLHFVSEHQKTWQFVNHPSFIIPNLLDPNLKLSSEKPTIKTGCVIGSVDKNKQVHISIQKALQDGCEKIYIFGKITDPFYWKQFVEPLVKDQVEYVGFVEDKQFIYDSCTDVYQDSLMETWGYIRQECKVTGTNFHGNKTTEDSVSLSRDEIINRWKVELGL